VLRTPGKGQRIGGRVHPRDSLIQVKKVEAGGELIGRNHLTWLAYAKQFGLSRNEVLKGIEADSPILLNGRRLVGKEVVQL
jgi:monoamine oxidase